MREVWVDVKGYEDRYEVSSFGRVRTKKRLGVHPKNKHGRTHLFKVPERIKSMTLDRYGYLRLTLNRGAHEKRQRTTHRLVAESFLGDTWFEGATVNHKDGNKENNSVGNLEWASMKDNIRHAMRLGLRKSRTL